MLGPSHPVVSRLMSQMHIDTQSPVADTRYRALVTFRVFSASFGVDDYLELTARFLADPYWRVQ